jgi:aspartate/methionine/tyrosine aminotransferase
MTSIDLGLGTIRLQQEATELSVYGTRGGSPELRDALAALHGVDPTEVVVTSGASLGLVALLAGHERSAPVLIPRPYYPGYLGMCQALGHEVRSYDARAISDPRALLADAPAGSLLLLNTPHNPTGAVVDERIIAHLVSQAPDVRVVVDRAYAGLCFTRPDDDGLTGVIPGCASVFSLSKRYAIPGARVGYVIAEASLTAEVELWHWRLAMTPAAPSQTAALAALENDQRPSLLRTLTERRSLALKLARAAGLRADAPDGGLFLWCRLCQSTDITATALLQQAEVDGVPGPAFGASHHSFRLSFAVPVEDLQEAFGRIGRCLESSINAGVVR